jgi:hypothetical protein
LTRKSDLPGAHKPKVPGSSPGAAIENFAKIRLIRETLLPVPIPRL